MFPIFKHVLESVEALSVGEQELLIDLVHRRLVEQRREEIAENIAQAQAEYESGKVFRGTLKQIMTELQD